jgi:LPXTG-motif cell wall-anchored protein
MTVSITNVNTGASIETIPDTGWVLRSHRYTAGQAIPGGGTVPLTLEIAPGVVLDPHPGVQVFWIHFTEDSLSVLADNASNADARITVNFRTVADIALGQLSGIPNDFSMTTRREGTNYMGSQRPIPTQEPFAITINKVNPSGYTIDGAIFRLWREADMGGTPGTTNRQPNSGASHIMTRVTGPTTLAATVPTLPAGATNPTQAQLDEVWVAGNFAPGQTAGVAIFDGLPRGVFYLSELFAPSGYTALEGWRRVVICQGCDCTETGSPPALPPIVSGACSECGCICRGMTTAQLPEGVAPGAGTVLNPAGNTTRVVTFNFRNTREFDLPLTGGAGTIMFTAAGVSLMGGAGLFLFLARKKERTQK